MAYRVDEKPQKISCPLPDIRLYWSYHNYQEERDMKTMQAHTMNLAGTSYEIGYGLGQMYANIPPLKTLHTQGMQGFGDEQAKEATSLFDRWCPGLTDELNGFADALKVPAKQILFY